MHAIEPKGDLAEFDGDWVEVDAEHVSIGDIGAYPALDVGALLMRDPFVQFGLLQLQVLVSKLVHDLDEESR
jgi:hypothetical protein